MPWLLLIPTVIGAAAGYGVSKATSAVETAGKTVSGFVIGAAAIILYFTLKGR